jgi:hypothetical protein
MMPQAKPSKCPRCRLRASREGKQPIEDGRATPAQIGWMRRLRESRVPVGGWSSAILRKNINIFQNSHQNSHSREKKKTAFWGGL